MKKVGIVLILVLMPMGMHGMDWLGGLFRKTSSTSVKSGTGQGEGGQVESRSTSERSVGSEKSQSEELTQQERQKKLEDDKKTVRMRQIKLKNELKNLRKKTPDEIKSPGKKLEWEQDIVAKDAQLTKANEGLQKINKELDELRVLFKPATVQGGRTVNEILLSATADKTKVEIGNIFDEAYKVALEEKDLKKQLGLLQEIVNTNNGLKEKGLKTHRAFQQVKDRIQELKNANSKLEVPNDFAVNLQLSGKPLTEQLNDIKKDLEKDGVIIVVDKEKDTEKLVQAAEAMQYYLDAYGKELQKSVIYKDYADYIDEIRRTVASIDPNIKIYDAKAIKDSMQYQSEIKLYNSAYEAAKSIYDRSVNEQAGLLPGKIDNTYATLIRQLTTIKDGIEKMDIKKDPMKNETNDQLLEKITIRLQEVKAFKEKYDANKKAAEEFARTRAKSGEGAREPILARNDFDMLNQLYKLPLSDQLSKIESVINGKPYNGDLSKIPQDVLTDIVDCMDEYSKNYSEGLDPEKWPLKEYSEYKKKLANLTFRGQLIGKSFTEQINIIKNFIDDKSPTGNIAQLPKELFQEVIDSMKYSRNRAGAEFDPAMSPFKEYDAYLRDLEKEFFRRFGSVPEAERSYINDLLNDPNSWLGKTITQARGALTGFIITGGEKISDIAQLMNNYAETVKQQAEQMQNAPYMVQDIYATVDSLIPLIDTAKAAVKIIPGDRATALFALLDGLGKKLEKLKGGQDALKGLAKWAADAGSYLKTASEYVAEHSQTIIATVPEVTEILAKATLGVPIEQQSPEQKKALINVKDTIEEIRDKKNEYKGPFQSIVKPLLALGDSIINKYRTYMVKDGVRGIENAQKKYDSAREELAISLGLTSEELVQLNAGTFDLNKKLITIREANDVDGVKQKKVVAQALKNYRDAAYKLASAYQKYQVSAAALESSYEFLVNMWDAAIEQNIPHDENSPLADQLRQILEKRANREKYLEDLEAKFNAVFIDARGALAQIHTAPYPGVTSILMDVTHMSDRLAATMKQETSENMNKLMRDIKAIDDAVAMAEKYKEPKKKE